MKTASAKDPIARRWVILAVLFTTRTVVGFHFQSVPALGPVIVQELGLDYALLGTIIGLFMLPGVVFALPGGVLGQRFGDMRIAVIGLALMVAGGGLLAVGSSVPLMAAGRLFSGIGAVFLNTVLAKMVTDWFAEREIVLAMALFVTSWPVGIGLALLSLPSLAAITSTSVALGSTAVLSGGALVLLLTAYRVPAGQIASRPPSVSSSAVGNGHCRSFRGWSGASTTSALSWSLFSGPACSRRRGCRSGQRERWQAL